MRLDLDDEQRQLQEGVRRFCDARYPLEVSRSHATGGLDRRRWAELGELGVFSLTIAHTSGGLGMRQVEAAVVFEALGEALVPGPLIACHLAAEHDPEVAAGRRVAAVVDTTQSPLLVENLSGADVAFVVAHSGVTRVDPADLTFEPLPQPFDPLTPVCSVTALAPGEPIGDAAQARQWRLRGSLLASAMLVGVAEAACQMGSAYAKVREQFNRPIGSFQALQHMLADTYARTEVARAAVYAAAAASDDPDASARTVERAVAVARVSGAQAAVNNTKTCVQVHGGMGFTWEADPHLLLKRAWALSCAFGSPDDAAETVASSLVG